MASAPTITPKKRSAREWDVLLSAANSTARQTIIPALASSLSRNCPGQWIAVLDLFEEGAMHGMTRKTVLNKGFFSESFFDSDGTTAYKFGEDRSILLRHKFASQWFVLGCRMDRKLLDKLALYIKEVMIQGNRPGAENAAVSELILGDVLKIVSPIVSAALSTVSTLINSRKAERTLAVVTPGSGRQSRTDVLTSNLQHVSNPLVALSLMTEKQVNE
jgi:hypothetical protein